MSFFEDFKKRQKKSQNEMLKKTMKELFEVPVGSSEDLRRNFGKFL